MYRYYVNIDIVLNIFFEVYMSCTPFDLKEQKTEKVYERERERVISLGQCLIMLIILQVKK